VFVIYRAIRGQLPGIPFCHGRKKVVVDAGRIANGPAGRNSGFMIDVPHDLSSDDYGGNTNNDHRDVQLNRAGIEYALAIKEAYGMTDEAIQVGGKINGAITSRGVSHNDAYAKHLAALNESFERLSALDMQQLLRLFPKTPYACIHLRFYDKKYDYRAA